MPVSKNVLACVMDLPPGKKIGFDRVPDSRRLTITPNGIVVVPAGYFPMHDTQSHFMAPSDKHTARGESSRMAVPA